jgi:hypothetical protein
MKYIFPLLLVVFLFYFQTIVNAQSGCCSWHGGVSHCDSSVGRKVCNDGTYSPTCACFQESEPIYIQPQFPISTNATYTFSSNLNKTYDIEIQLNDSNPTQYSAVISKCMGCDPGPKIDFYTNKYTFTNVSPGTWYVNVKKNISGSWSNVVYWTVDVPSWVAPTPVPTKFPTTTKVINSITPTPEPLISEDKSSLLVIIFITIVGIVFGSYVVYVVFLGVRRFHRYAKENDWVYTAIFWIAMVGGIILYNTMSDKPKTNTRTERGRYECNCSKTCPNLTCDEAQYQLNVCGCSARDGDNDGTACDAQCN